MVQKQQHHVASLCTVSCPCVSVTIPGKPRSALWRSLDKRGDVSEMLPLFLPLWLLPCCLRRLDSGEGGHAAL